MPGIKRSTVDKLERALEARNGLIDELVERLDEWYELLTIGGRSHLLPPDVAHKMREAAKDWRERSGKKK